MSLYNIYRPQTFEEMIGQEIVIQVLKNSIKHNRFPNCVILHGPSGIGKTSLARIIVKALNCENSFESGDCCKKCSWCKSLKNDEVPDCCEIDAGTCARVDDIRNLIEASRYKPLIAKYRTFILDEFQNMSRTSISALLKTIEDSFPFNKFILVTTEMDKIPNSILTRSIMLELDFCPDDECHKLAKNICKSEKITIEEGLLKALIISSQGMVRQLITKLEVVKNLNSDCSIDDKFKAIGCVNTIFLKECFLNLLKGDLKGWLNYIRNIAQTKNQSVFIIKEILNILNLSIEQKLDSNNLNNSNNNEIIKIFSEKSLQSIQTIWNSFFTTINSTNFLSDFNRLEIASINLFHHIFTEEDPFSKMILYLIENKKQDLLNSVTKNVKREMVSIHEGKFIINGNPSLTKKINN